MLISAQVTNRQGSHQVALKTNDQSQSISIPPKPGGYGSSVNGGELLFLALATCYCNDIYREAKKREIVVESVEVEVSGTFGATGEPAVDVAYTAKVTAKASEETIRQLMTVTDRMAEIQNTLRMATPVKLSGMEAVSTE